MSRVVVVVLFLAGCAAGPPPPGTSGGGCLPVPGTWPVQWKCPKEPAKKPAGCSPNCEGPGKPQVPA